MNLFIRGKINASRTKWVEALQDRLNYTRSILAQMPAVKMHGLGELLMDSVQARRDTEMRRMKAYRTELMWCNLLGFLPSIWSPFLTFSAYAAEARGRGTELIGLAKAFASLAIILLVTDAANTLITSVVHLSAAVGSWERTQKFLLAPPQEDKRIPFPRSLSSDRPKAIDEAKAAVGYGSLGNVAVRIQEAHFGPSVAGVSLLRDVNLQIPRGTVTMVVGPTGSGKSALLQAILGELPLCSGRIELSSTKIAYCGQTAWLPTAEVQHAICGPPAICDRSWYHKVLQACAPEEDLAALPQGHRTVVNSTSTLLSGGQRQRVTLARALYSCADIMVLDDILSALDSSTRDHIVAQILGNAGLLRVLGSTVILVIHDSEFGPYGAVLIRSIHIPLLTLKQPNILISPML